MAVSDARAEIPSLRFRHHRARAVAGLIVLISLFTLVAVWPWAALLVLVPAAWIGVILRAGTDVDQQGITVRALLGKRRLSWAEIDVLAPERPDRVFAVLHNGKRLPLTAMRAADLPALTAAPRAS